MRTAALAPRRRHYDGTLHRRRTAQAEPELPIVARVDALPGPQVRPLADQREPQLWREYVERYHYLGYTPLPGAQQRYLVISERQVLAVAGFGASGWKAAPVPASARPTGSTSDRPKAAANSMSTSSVRCPRRTSGSTHSDVTSDATCALLSILLPTGRPNVHPVMVDWTLGASKSGHCRNTRYVDSCSL